MNWHYIEPLDVLYLRGNKLFGDPGSYGESLVPPWPSAVAGAIRSAILVRDRVDLAVFAQSNEGAAHPVLGTPAEPGEFTVRAFHLARHTEGGLEAVYAPPADLVITKTDDDVLQVSRLQPEKPQQGIDCSMPTASLPVLACADRAKPETGWWLTQAAFVAYLTGNTPDTDGLLKTDKLWRTDERVGVGLDPGKRRAEDGKLFSMQAVAFCEGVGFLAATEGDGLKADTLLRFGGDGRAARCEPVDAYRSPEPDLANIAESGRARMVLTTPGIFPEGWRLPGMSADGRFELAGVKGRVVAAAVNRAEVISGWDLAAKKGRGQPKVAQRAAPAGSVYWIEDLEADEASLRKLAEHGLWPENDYDKHRRAEGFNRFTFAAY